MTGSKQLRPFSDIAKIILFPHVSPKPQAVKRKSLEQLYESLSQVLGRLKKVNEMNRQLTRDALQFISISYDMLVPKENNFNYSKSIKAEPAEKQPNETV